MTFSSRRREPPDDPHGDKSTLRLRRIGIDTYQEPVIYMAADCPVCLAEGWEASTRIEVHHADHTIVATLNVVTGDLLAPDEASLSEAAWRMLGASEGDMLTLAHPRPLSSLRHLRAKVHGARLDASAVLEIIRDISTGSYSAIELAAFVAACAGGRLDQGEIIALTSAMVDVGERLSWPGRSVIVDKHSVGGLPGNRTTMLIVPIVTACGLTMPKTSSRGITSPAGTADAMETVAPVTLDVPTMRRVVEREGGCIVWGGAVRLSPADDVIIRVERPLDIDSEGQLVASVLSKKLAAGSTHVVIDIPVGPTAKVRTTLAAEELSRTLVTVGQAVGLHVDVALGDGSQPIGRGMGPALEARDVLAVLRREGGGPNDLEERALVLAGRLLELGGAATSGEGYDAARRVLHDGNAYRKFEAICEAQGGMREPTTAPFSMTTRAPSPGRITGMDSRRLARTAKLAGAPRAHAAGLDLHVRLGADVDREQPLFTLHAESPGELAYARAYAEANTDMIDLLSGKE